MSCVSVFYTAFPLVLYTFYRCTLSCVVVLFLLMEVCVRILLRSYALPAEMRNRPVLLQIALMTLWRFGWHRVYYARFLTLMCKILVGLWCLGLLEVLGLCFVWCLWKRVLWLRYKWCLCGEVFIVNIPSWFNQTIIYAAFGDQTLVLFLSRFQVFRTVLHNHTPWLSQKASLKGIFCSTITQAREL